MMCSAMFLPTKLWDDISIDFQTEQALCFGGLTFCRKSNTELMTEETFQNYIVLLERAILFFLCFNVLGSPPLVGKLIKEG